LLEPASIACGEGAGGMHVEAHYVGDGLAWASAVRIEQPERGAAGALAPRSTPRAAAAAQLDSTGSASSGSSPPSCSGSSERPWWTRS
jgi:hypothetical protein